MFTAIVAGIIALTMVGNGIAYHNQMNNFRSSQATTNAIGVYNRAQVETIRNIFCPVTYARMFPDLMNAFGDGRTQSSATNLWNHFHRYGLSGREPARLTGFSPVFEPIHYFANNPDLVQAFGSDRYLALQHFVVHGMREGRNSSPSFSVQFYQARYQDLRNAFGGQLDRYYIHYVQHGIHEGRTAR